MSTTETPTPEAQPAPHRAEPRGEPSTRNVALILTGLVALSALVRAVLSTRIHSPTAFSDELGYDKLAQSIGLHGKLALFDEPGLSYSPLYPLVLSPVYALGASAATAYTAMKVVSAVTISLALFPIYAIARSVLPRRHALIAVALASVAPLMVYPSFTMSENVSYPVCMLAVWALLVAIRTPVARADVVLIVAIVAAGAARTQLVVLIPAAATALVLAAIFGRQPREGIGTALRRMLSEHAVLVGAVVLVGLAAVAAAVAGYDVLAAFGRYSNIGQHGLPNVWHFLNVFLWHLAGIDLAVGVVPFVAALVIGYAFVRSGWNRAYLPFAAVAVSVTTWFLLEVGLTSSVFDGPHRDVPRIHERFLIYVVPFFLIALLAAFRVSAARAPYRAYLVAGGIATALTLAIPFHTVVNQTIAVDTMGLHPFARVVHGRLAALPHATLVAIWLAGTLSLLYAQMRQRLRSIVLITLVPLVGISIMAQSRIEDAANVTRALLPAHTDWIDQAHPVGPVVLVSGQSPVTSELETAYANLSIDRLYYLCRPIVGSEFGERRATIDRSGALRGPSGVVKAAYVVGRTRLGLRGRVVARDRPGHLVLVAPENGTVAVAPGRRARLLRCPAPQSLS